MVGGVLAHSATSSCWWKSVEDVTKFKMSDIGIAETNEKQQAYLNMPINQRTLVWPQVYQMFRGQQMIGNRIMESKVCTFIKNELMF